MGEFEILGTRLKLLRKRLKVNQIEFSKMIGISSATLSAYETGVKNPSLAVLKNIAETCNVSIDWLCGLSEKESLSSDDSIKTYSDIIKMLVEMEKYISINCRFFTMIILLVVIINLQKKKLLVKLYSTMEQWLILSMIGKK